MRSSSSNHRIFSLGNTAQRNRTATWLSPLAQPTAPAASKSTVPTDLTLRKFLGQTAISLEQLVLENESYFGEAPESSFNAYPLHTVSEARNEARPETVQRSINNAPIKVPWQIPHQSVAPSLQVSKETGLPQSGTLRYCWLERGFLSKQDSKVHEGVYTFQVRHHTKLEAFHEMRKPVYCINLKSDAGDFINLRLMMLIHTELPFLHSAAARFARPDDHFEGSPVTDHHGRTYVDEQVIRRAGYAYAEYQRTRFVEGKSIIPDDEVIPDEVLFAHFLVFRSHLPELAAPSLVSSQHLQDRDVIKSQGVL